MAFLTRRLLHDYEKLSLLARPAIYRDGENLKCHLSNVELDWMLNSYKKVCVVVETEAELNTLYVQAKHSGLEVHLITDSGKTEFNGVPTITALAIGPDEDEKIDIVTGGLPLY